MENNTYDIWLNYVIYDLIYKNKWLCLDVWCWKWNLWKKLIDNKEMVLYWVEFNIDAWNNALEKWYKKVYNIDLNNYTNLVLSEKFDYIIFWDILEHLVNPWKVLSDFKEFLKPDWKIIISLPNIAFLLYRLKLLFWKFDYEETWVMDKTHLRFFTKKSAESLILSNWLIIEKFQIWQIIRKNLFWLKILWFFFPSLFSLQLVFLVSKK